MLTDKDGINIRETLVPNSNSDLLESNKFGSHISPSKDKSKLKTTIDYAIYNSSVPFTKTLPSNITANNLVCIGNGSKILTTKPAVIVKQSPNKKYRKVHDISDSNEYSKTHEEYPLGGSRYSKLDYYGSPSNATLLFKSASLTRQNDIGKMKFFYIAIR